LRTTRNHAWDFTRHSLPSISDLRPLQELAGLGGARVRHYVRALSMLISTGVAFAMVLKTGEYSANSRSFSGGASLHVHCNADVF
jgi:hypothetical protein